MFKKNTYPGKFFAFEGLDGSGQTTQSRLMRDYLKEKGHKVVLTKEPDYNSESGRLIGKVLRHEKEMSAIELQKLFVKNRKEHLDDVIIPVLELGGIVISDRYFFATCAYGAGADKIDLTYLIEMNEMKNFILPDITFILDVPAEICIKRIAKRGGKFEHFEKEDKLKMVRDVYLKLARLPGLENIFLIDGKDSKENVFKQVKGGLKDY